MTNKLIYFLLQSHLRSLMAEAWAKRLLISDVTFISGSWQKARDSHFVKDALHEVSITTPKTSSFAPSQKLLNDADLIITIYDSTYERLPNFPADTKGKIIYWGSENPEQINDKLMKWASYQEVCDRIALSVKKLAKDLAKPYDTLSKK